MHAFAELAIGCAGLLYFFAAFSRQGLQVGSNNILTGVGLTAAAVMFLAGMPDEVASFSSAGAVEYCAILGRILGIAGCARAAYTHYRKVG